jgi:hypothetical protein
VGLFGKTKIRDAVQGEATVVGMATGWPTRRPSSADRVVSSA